MPLPHRPVPTLVLKCTSHFSLIFKPHRILRCRSTQLFCRIIAVLIAKSFLLYSIRYVMGRRYLYQDKHTHRCHHPKYAPCQSVLTQCQLAHKREASAPPHMAVIVCFRFSFYPHEVPPSSVFSNQPQGPTLTLAAWREKTNKTESCFQ